MTVTTNFTITVTITDSLYFLLGSSPRRRLSSKSKHKMFDTETVKTQEEEEKSFYYFITDDNYVGDEEVQLSGYINYNYYSDSDCTGNVTLTSGQGYYNNTCYPADIGEVYKSYRLVGFSNDCTFLKMVAYRNDDCTDYIGTTKQYINSCNNNIDDGVSMSYRGFCSAGVELPLSKESVVFR